MPGPDSDPGFQELRAYHHRRGVLPDQPFPVGTPEYEDIYADLGGFLRDFASRFGYYDIFVICSAHGHVMYTVARESDLGANVSSGPLRSTGLGQLWRRVVESQAPVFADYAPYPPSGGDPAAFVGAPMVVGGEAIGVIALQLPHQHVNAIMQERAGMGKTGETYLVGPVG